MISGCLLACIAAGVAPFDVHAFPMGTASARYFVMPATPDGIADLFILDDFQLHFFDDALPENGHTLDLPPDSSAIDLFDLDGDGESELIVIAGMKVLRYPLTGENRMTAETLFSLPYSLAGWRAPPFIQPLVARRDEGVFFLVPHDARLEVFSMQGEPVTANAVALEHNSSQASSREVLPSSLVSDEGRELRFEYAWKPEAQHDDADSLVSLSNRSPGPYQLRQAARQPTDRWPWLPLTGNTPTSTSERAYIAVEGDETGETLVRIRRHGADTSTAFRLGPVRRYPGQPLWPEGMPPDFNGDGYADLLLWRTRAPAPTINALSRAVSAGTWPIDLAVHLYDPAAFSFAPRPLGKIRIQTPIASFFQGGPQVIPHAIAADLDGDGRTDLGCATSESQFSIWSWQKDRLSSVPLFETTTGSPILDVAFHTPLAEGGGEVVGLRTQTHLVLLYPKRITEDFGLEDPNVRARIRYLRGLVETP